MNRVGVQLLLAVACVASTGPALADLALANSKNCMSCHAVDHKVLGPAFKEVAAKYDGQADAATLLAGRIKNGTQGTWGAVPMPANAVTEEEAKTLAEWVLSHKK